MANIKSIGGNPIVPTAVEPNSVTDAMLVQTGGVLDRVAEINDGYYAFDLTPNVYILRDSGAESPYNGWSATDYIPCPPHSSLVCECPSTLSWGARYDSSKTYVEAYGWTNLASYYNSTDSITYFRVSGANNVMDAVKFRVRAEVDQTLNKLGVPAESRAVGNRLSELEGMIRTETEAIPSYYETQLTTKEATIRGHFDDCAYNGDGLVFITDTHFSTDLFTSDNPTSYFNANNSFSLIKSITAKCGIGKVVFGGDLVNSATDVDTMLLCASSFRNRFGDEQARLRYCVGNHEYFTGADMGQTTKPTPEMLYGAAIKYNEDSVGAYGPMATYYFDNIAQKIRYFVISCGRDTETTTGQVAWVLKQFESIPEGYHVVCIGHGFMTDNMTAFRYSYKPIADALDAVKAGTTFTYSSVTYDYSGLTDVTPVCMITGQTHIDGSITTDGGIPCICTTCDSYAQNYELVDGTPTSAPRTKGTVDEQAFDVIQFDFDARKIYCTRIGYGSNREFSY